MIILLISFTKFFHENLVTSQGGCAMFTVTTKALNFIATISRLAVFKLCFGKKFLEQLMESQEQLCFCNETINIRMINDDKSKSGKSREKKFSFALRHSTLVWKLLKCQSRFYNLLEIHCSLFFVLRHRLHPIPSSCCRPLC